MKWILAICLLISITSLGQTDDSTKYIHYKAQYGQRMPRGWWDSVAHMPYGDTALFAKPARPGAIMMHTNKLFYRWDGTGWRELGSGSGVASLKSAGNGFSLVLPPDSIRSLEPFGSWIAIDTSVDRKKARIYITPQAGDGLKVNPFTDAIERDTTRSTGIPTYHYIDSLANLEDSLVIVNQGDGENISYIQNDSIVIKKITGTGAATVTTANDSTIVIDVEATTPLLTSTQVAYGSGTNEMTSEPSFNYTAASNALHADSMLTIRTRADSLFANHRIGIGTTQPQFFLHSQGSNPTIGIVDTRALSSTNGASILLYNQGTPSAAGQRLGQFLFGTNPSGTTFRNSAAVAAYSNGAWTDGSSHPTDIAFEITQAGGSSRVEVARFKSTGQLGIGTSAPHMRLTLAGSSSSSTQTGVEAYQYGGALGGVFVGLSSRGTESVPTATQANDTIARFGGAGYGTSQTAPYTTGTVQVLAEENFTNTSMPTGMLFQTTPTGSNVRLNRMYIAANGGVRIGSTSWAADIAARTFYINGSA